MLRKALFVMVFTIVVVGLSAAPALAHDHLFNAAHAPGAEVRGFANPVAGNPSGVSGPAADPATVPGGGDPKVGVSQGTPSVDLSLVNVRSGGHGTPQQ